MHVSLAAPAEAAGRRLMQVYASAWAPGTEACVARTWVLRLASSDCVRTQCIIAHSLAW